MLEDDSTGRNIASLLINELTKLEIPFENCIGFCSDNAAVMIGKKNGVATFLQVIQKELITVGCPCHLINLAAEKAAATLPNINVDQILVDIFYYFEKSAKRKEDLKRFQKLHCDDTKKILKHVCTRWLSLGRALKRFIEQWEPLLSFFHEKVKSKPLASSLSLYKIPKVGKPTTTRKRVLDKNENINSEPIQKKIKCTENVVTEKKNRNVLTQEENIFLFLSSDINKVFCSFVLNTLPTFERTNISLQSGSPLIPYLNRMLNEFLKELFVKFVKPSVVKSFVKLTDIPYHNLDNQKDDNDLIIGTETTKLLKEVKPNDKKDFYCAVRQYFVTACDYIVKKFPIDSEVLQHAEVADLKEIDKASFNSIKYFVEKFPFLLTVKEGENHDDAMDELYKEFLQLQLEQLNKNEKNDVLFKELNNMLKIDGGPKYDRILKVLAAIFSIPHSNAECERIFSMVKKTELSFALV